MTARLSPAQRRVVDSMRAQVLEAGLHEVNGVRSDIGLPPLEQLVPAPLDEASDDPIPLDRCPITLSVIAGAPEGWACRWEGWDKIEITRPGRDPILMVVPACVDLHILWGRGDVPALTLDPGDSEQPTFLSLFSGAGGLDLGLHRAGWECIGQVEADPWRRSILARHWPDIPQHHDVTTFNPEGITCDLIAGGFPCQDVSVAGRRAGLAGERTGLFWDAVRIVDAVRPRFVLLENVVGLLTSNDGGDFRVVVGALADLGYGVAWRVLDSRYFGVPQRRRRVFIVGALAPGRAGAERAGAILAVGESCERHPAAGQEAGPESAFRVAAGVGARRVGRTLTKAPLVKGGHEDSTADYVVSTLQAAKGRGYRVDAESAAGGHLVPTVAATVKAHRGKGGGGLSIEETLLPQVFNPTRTLTDDGTEESWQEKDVANALMRPSGNKMPVVAMNLRGRDGGAMPEMTDVASVRAASGGSGRSYVAGSMVGVRRLTPTECCRLQGFPDDWFGKPNERPDGPRYAALGDAVTVPVAEWIGRRLLEAAS